ncbi:hypothetical protein [Streptomyces sp. F-1]|uniref:hypothetical protein n=1 Tax=Streptomyces sp. F-1 TaxID=463642 RepID=UPI00085C4689|nr:hypothetical protein [Streptomyces sp. F-1]SFY52082.1 hypothetical protein STEPF1_05351 [Streptomyces sp. F-1]
MSSLNDHVPSNTKYDAQKAAAKAILAAIPARVEAVLEEDGGEPYTAARLKELAEVYALVVHGTKN